MRTPRDRARRIALTTVGLAISAFFAYLALRSVSLEAVEKSLAAAHYWWLVPSCALVVVSVVLRSLRWRILFRDPKSVTLVQSVEGMSIGLALNNFLPGRAGEVARVFAVRRTAGLSAFEIGATVVVERVLDTFALAVIGLLVWFWLPAVGWVHLLVLACLAVVLAFAGLLLFLVFFRAQAADLLERGLRRLPLVSDERARTTRLALVAGSAALVNPRRLAQAMALGVGVWLTNGLVFVTLMPAFDLNAWSVAPWLALVAVSLAIAIPSGPATIGVFEAAIQAALVACGIGPSVALSYAVVVHLASVVPVVLMGAAASWAVARAAPEPLHWGRPSRPGP